MEMGTILLTTTKASEGALSFSTKPTENTIKSKKKKNCTIVDVCRRSKMINSIFNIVFLFTEYNLFFLNVTILPFYIAVEVKYY
jgi:hypothetical protein